MSGQPLFILICHYRSEELCHSYRIQSVPSNTAITQTNITEPKEEVVLSCEQLDRLQRVSGSDTYSETVYKLLTKRTDRFEWPFESIMKTIRNSINSLKQ